MGQDVCLLRKKSPGHSTEYLQSVFQSPIVLDQLSNLMVGSTFKRANVEQIRNFSVPMPSSAEQRAIASALSDADALLTSLARLIAKKRDLKQAAMQQLLIGQTRLPGFHGEWVVKRLGEVGEISSAGVDKKIRPDEVPVRLVNYLDVYRKDFIYSDDLNHWVSAPPLQAKRCAVQKGDVFFTPTSETRDDIGISTVAMEDIPDAAYSYHVARLRLREPWDLCFRTYAFKTRAFLDQAETLCDGNGTRYVISQGKFRSMTVQVPPLPEQTAIAAVLTEMDAELAVLEQRQAKTRALKQGMMQELLTGRTRLI
jgi:type I restriction enzyme S subunit